MNQNFNEVVGRRNFNSKQFSIAFSETWLNDEAKTAVFGKKSQNLRMTKKWRRRNELTYLFLKLKGWIFQTN